MNEKIKKTFRAITSAVLAGAFVVSSVIAGGADSFVSPSVTLAAEGESNIPAGIYSVPIVRTYSENNSSKDTSSPLHFYPRAILSVDETGNTKLTIGVENWSLYDAFIPRKQGYINENNKADILPSVNALTGILPLKQVGYK